MQWREKRAAELAEIGVTQSVPQWKRLEIGEYEDWASSTQPELLSAAHRFCAPNPSNPALPADGAGELGDHAVHWCDINQPYEALPERWKEKNRIYAVPDSATRAVDEASRYAAATLG